MNPLNPIPYFYPGIFFLQFTPSEFIQLTLKGNGAYVQMGTWKLLCSPSPPELTSAFNPTQPREPRGRLEVSAATPPLPGQKLQDARALHAGVLPKGRLG